MFKYLKFLWDYRRRLWPWQLRHRSVNRGFIQGRRGWQILGLVLYGHEIMRKALRSEPELVATARLEPGAAVKIETIDPRSKRGR